jgi:DNA (cytosine-5)-methyltransferase 1
MGMGGGQTPLVWSKKIKIRRLTPMECERLQGFPDNWTEGISDTQRYKTLGNAVTVNVVRAIAGRLFSSGMS